MSLIKTPNKEWVWQRIGFEDNRGKVILGLLEAYVDSKRVLGLEELKPLMPLNPKEVADAYRRTAKEFLLFSRKLTVSEDSFRDLETLDVYKKAPYKGRSLKEALELLIAEAKRNNIKFPKVLKKTGIEPDSPKEYLPTKEDCEKAIETLKKIISNHQISEKEVLNYLEFHLQDKGITLSKDWRAITKENFKGWFK